MNGQCGNALNTCSAGDLVRIDNTRWQCAGRCGGRTVDCPPAPCPRQTESWGSGCSSDVGPTAAGTSATVSNTVGCRTGSATFQCSSSGSWGSATNASCTVTSPVNGQCGNALNTCSAGDLVRIDNTRWQCAGRCGGRTVDCPPAPCPRQTESWGSGCSSDVGPTAAGTSATVSNTVGCRTGSATFQCSSSGSWGSATNASCTVTSPVNGRCGNALNTCSAGDLVRIDNTRWQCAGRCGGRTVDCRPPPCPSQSVSWGSCSSRVGPTDAETSVTVSDTASCRSGSATFQCGTDGSWGSATSTSCTVSPAQNGACSATGCSVGTRVGGTATWQCRGICGGTTVDCRRPTFFTVSVSVSVSGNTATASAAVSGGTPPYSYSWRVVGSGWVSDPSTGSSLTMRTRRAAPSFPDVAVTVTDSTGATTSDHTH